MLVEIKYIRKDEPKSLRKAHRSSFLAETKDDGRAMFESWLYKNGLSPRDVVVLVVRDATTDTITLDVQDVKQTQKGKV